MLFGFVMLSGSFLFSGLVPSLRCKLFGFSEPEHPSSFDKFRFKA